MKPVDQLDCKEMSRHLKNLLGDNIMNTVQERIEFMDNMTWLQKGQIVAGLMNFGNWLGVICNNTAPKKTSQTLLDELINFIMIIGILSLVNSVLSARL